MKEPGKVLIIAHRGASGHAPENTLSAIKKAIELGADMVEVDVQLTSDSVPVLFHDRTIERTTNGKGKISDYTFKELKKLDAGSWFSREFKGEKIPSLAEVLELTKNRVQLLIELKPGNVAIVKKTLDCILEKKATDICIIQSFSNRLLKAVVKEHSHIRIQKVVLGNIAFLPIHLDIGLKLGRTENYKIVSGVNHNYRFVNRRLVNKMHRRNKTVYVWTVNDPKEMKKMISKGVDGIITNYPDVLKEMIRR